MQEKNIAEKNLTGDKSQAQSRFPDSIADANRRAEISLACSSILSLPTKAADKFYLVFSFTSVSTG